MIEAVLKEWDGEGVIIRYDHLSGAWIFIAIHSSLLGPPTGGTRMKTYSSPEAALQDALKLAAGMTYKYAAANFARGGGKAVIALPANFDPTQRRDLLLRYGALIRQLNGSFYTGPDVGTSSEDMDVIGETGAPYIFSRTPAKGGAGSSGPATALGVFSAMQAVGEKCFGSDSLSGRKILVQGAGGVGGTLIEMLVEDGAEVSFSDLDQNAIRRFRDEMGLHFVEPDQIFDTECDIFSPCAMGGILNEQTVKRLKCKAIVGAANNQLATERDAQRLKEYGIMYAPDFVISIGGAMAITGMEALGWSSEQAEAEVRRVKTTLLKILELAESRDITTEAAARRLAQARLAAAAI